MLKCLFRPKTGFQLWLEENRKSIIADHPNLEETDIIKEAMGRFRTLSADERLVRHTEGFREKYGNFIWWYWAQKVQRYYIFNQNDLESTKLLNFVFSLGRHMVMFHTDWFFGYVFRYLNILEKIFCILAKKIDFLWNYTKAEGLAVLYILFFRVVSWFGSCWQTINTNVVIIKCRSTNLWLTVQPAHLTIHPFFIKRREKYVFLALAICLYSIE